VSQQANRKLEQEENKSSILGQKLRVESSLRRPTRYRDPMSADRIQGVWIESFDRNEWRIT